MPTKKTTKSSSIKSHARVSKNIEPEVTQSTSEPVVPETSISKVSGPNLKFLVQLVIILALGTGLFLLASRYRGYVIAAVVNRTPISRWQLNQVLASRYGKPVLDELISQELLTQEAKKQNVQINQADIDKEYKSLEDKLGGADNLKQALTQYGLTKDELQQQIRLRLIQTKLSDKLFNIQISDDDAKKYFTDNAALFKDKKFDDVKDDIKTTLKNQQLQDKFTTWFNDLKSKSSISIYLK